MKKYSIYNRRAFTLAEIMVSTGIVVLFGVIFYASANMATILYYKNFSLNETHGFVRGVCEKVSNRVHHAVEPPRLLDRNGAEVAGNGPAPGISCLVQASTLPYNIASLTAINQNTMLIKSNTNQDKPRSGDFIFISQIKGVATLAQSSVFYAEVLTATPSGVDTTVIFQNNISTYFDPPLSGAPMLTVNQPINLFKKVGFVANTINGVTNLRYYPNFMSVARNGQINFDNPDNFQDITGIVPKNNETESTPFSYTDPTRRYIDLEFRTISREVDQRGYQEYNYYQQFHTVIAYRSVTQQILQPL